MNFLKTLLLTLFLTFSFAYAKDPLIIGKIVKTKHESYSTNYFILMQKDGENYAYPISPDSSVKNLHKMQNKTFKIYGETAFKKDPNKEGSFVLYFKVDKAEELQLKDLALKEEINLQDPKILKKTVMKEKPRPGSVENLQMEINDKVANTVIILGGAALAADILSHILK